MGLSIAKWADSQSLFTALNRTEGEEAMVKTGTSLPRFEVHIWPFWLTSLCLCVL